MNQNCPVTVPDPANELQAARRGSLAQPAGAPLCWRCWSTSCFTVKVSYVYLHLVTFLPLQFCPRWTVSVSSCCLVGGVASIRPTRWPGPSPMLCACWCSAPPIATATQSCRRWSNTMMALCRRSQGEDWWTFTPGWRCGNLNLDLWPLRTTFKTFQNFFIV